MKRYRAALIPTGFPPTNGSLGLAIRKAAPNHLILQEIFWCQLRDLNSRPTVYTAAIGSFRGV